MSLTDLVAERLIEAGFQPMGDGRYRRPVDDGAVDCALGFGAKSRLERVTWWIPLRATASREVSAYRGSGRPVLDEPVALTIRPEGWRDRAGKRLGLNAEVEIGDPDFDERVYLEGDDEEGVRQMLSSAELRGLVLELFSDGVAVVAVRRGLGRLSVVREDLLHEIDVVWLERLVRRLRRAHDRLPAFRRLPNEGQPGPNAFQRTGLGLVALAFAGFFAAGWAEEDVIVATATSPATLAVAIVGAVIVAASTYRICAGRSGGLRYFLLIAIPGVAAWMLWTLGVALMLR